MYLRDLTLGPTAETAGAFPPSIIGEIASCAHCMVEMYLSFLIRKIHTDDISKVCIIAELSTHVPPTREDVKQLIRVLHVPWPFDAEEFLAAGETDRKRLFVETIHNALTWVGEMRGWDLAPIHSAYEKCIGSDFMFAGFWTKKSWQAPDRRHYVKIYFEFSTQFISLYATLFDRKNMEVARVLLAKERAQADGLRNLIGHGQWISPSCFQLRSKRTYWQKTWTANFDDVPNFTSRQ